MQRLGFWQALVVGPADLKRMPGLALTVAQWDGAAGQRGFKHAGGIVLSTGRGAGNSLDFSVAVADGGRGGGGALTCSKQCTWHLPGRSSYRGSFEALPWGTGFFMAHQALGWQVLQRRAAACCTCLVADSGGCLVIYRAALPAPRHKPRPLLCEHLTAALPIYGRLFCTAGLQPRVCVLVRAVPRSAGYIRRCGAAGSAATACLQASSGTVMASRPSCVC